VPASGCNLPIRQTLSSCINLIDHFCYMQQLITSTEDYATTVVNH
jgi:hypothetical protein